MVKDILIYGFGGFGREVACLIQHINRGCPTWNILGYIDDGVEVGTECRYGKVLGNIDTLNAWDRPVAVVIAIGSRRALEMISKRITNRNVEFPNIIAPDVFCFDESSVTMGKGNIITFGCRISCNVQLGDFNVLNGCVSLGHDVRMGSYNMLFPEVRISGQAAIGNSNAFGARCFCLQCLTIGDGNRFGAGSYILRKIKDGGFYMGNPCKKIVLE